jgi:hypothetical protein
MPIFHVAHRIKRLVEQVVCAIRAHKDWYELYENPETAYLLSGYTSVTMTYGNFFLSRTRADRKG